MHRMSAFSEEGKKRFQSFLDGLAAKHAKHDEERAAVTGKDMVFTIEPYEQKMMNEWAAEHRKTCKMRWNEDGTRITGPGGAAGGLTTYKFTPTGIGLATIVECACGEECNITDYDIW